MKCRLEIILVLLCAVGMIAACDGTCETCYAGNGGASYCTECVSSTDAILVDVSDFNHGGGSTDDSELHGTCTDEDTIENFGYPEITSGFYADNRGASSYVHGPPGYYYDCTTGLLGACDASCFECAGSLATECTYCEEGAGYFSEYQSTNQLGSYYMGACVTDCSAGTFQDGDSCIKCNPLCETCYGGTSMYHCTSCPTTNPILYVADRDEFSGICIPDCNNGLLDEYTNTCYGFGNCPEGTDRDNETCEPGETLEECCLDCLENAYE